MTKVFIDGSAGTTGLRIVERLESRKDIDLIRLPEELRKCKQARQDAINASDVVFLCLPDEAAIEAVSLVQNPAVKIIDTSTAHRTDSDWVYGFLELCGQRQKVQQATKVANPGCHASGFIALIAPLVQQGILKSNAHLNCFSLTGYSGGGKKMISEYASAQRSVLLDGPRQYALSQQHKHLKEMVALCNLDTAPIFCPIVADFYSGMEVTVPLFGADFQTSVQQLKDLYATYYSDGFVRFSDCADPDGMLSAAAFGGRDDMQIGVFGNDDRILLCARYDNLGKGASGAAIQNMNILLGVDESTGLMV